jgi:Na+/glutamate symporter
LDGSPSLLDNAPDSNTLGITLGGFGIVASLLTGGIVLYRKQRLARLAEQEAAIATEFELTEAPADATVTAAKAKAEVEAEKAVVLTR